MKENSASQSGLFNPRRLTAFALCSAGVLLAMWSFAASPAKQIATPKTSLASAAGSWSIVSSPNTDPTQYNQLFSVACPSASGCWAVGYYCSGQLTDSNNFRSDVTLDGRLNVNDTNFVKSHSGHSLP